MRVLFITRTHPHKSLGALEMRLHARLTELSELGHEVLVLTKWTGDPIDFDLPARIEIRSPFKTFRPWEWTRALPMVFAWRPDLLHVFDPGLSAIERTLSVELMAMTMLETLKRASRGRSPFLGSLVSIVTAGSRDGWEKAGAKFVENEWLHPVGGERLSNTRWDLALDRKLHFVLAGQVGRDRKLESVLDALDYMRVNSNFELTVYLDRSKLSASDRKRLGIAERAEAFGVAVGSRLRVVPPLDPSKTIENGAAFDAAIIAGLEPKAARTWMEQIAIPVVLSELQKPISNELQTRGMHACVLGGLVTEIAAVVQALALATDRERLSEAWLKIEQGSSTGGRDVAANHVSRIYSQIAGTGSNSYA